MPLFAEICILRYITTAKCRFIGTLLPSFTVSPLHAGFNFVPLVSFNGTNGATPNALVQGTDGNFYGTSQYGGNYGKGTAFMMTTNGTLTNAVSFDGTNGATPIGPLVQGVD